MDLNYQVPIHLTGPLISKLEACHMSPVIAKHAVMQIDLQARVPAFRRPRGPGEPFLAKRLQAAQLKDARFQPHAVFMHPS